MALVATLALGTVSMQAADSPFAPSAQARGYRLREYRWDAVLGQRWAVLEYPGHPERPLLAELAGVDLLEGGGEKASAPPAPPPFVRPAAVIHSGDAVTLWTDEANVLMQLSAIAEGNAALGEHVQLRVTGAGVNGNAGWRATGVVRGPGSVEME